MPESISLDSAPCEIARRRAVAQSHTLCVPSGHTCHGCPPGHSTYLCHCQRLRVIRLITHKARRPATYAGVVAPDRAVGKGLWRVCPVLSAPRRPPLVS
jgi:hypothetical protein